jgi:hypothetical protein
MRVHYAYILRVKIPNVYALKLCEWTIFSCDADCVLKNTLGDWCRTHLSRHRGPDNICNKVDSECAYDSVVEAKGHQNFCEDLLRWKFSFVHLHIFSPKSLNRDLFQILGAYLATMYATLVAVLVLLETSNRNYRIPPYWYCCVYRLIEILPNLQLLNAIF